MTEIQALQEEEREVLSSIYEGDDCYKQVSSTVFQYKYGVSDTMKSLLLELKWGPKYPEELPEINLEVFYNRHIIPTLKEKVKSLVKTEAEQYLGMSMTYSLFEFVKEKFDELIEEQPDKPLENDVDKLCISEDVDDSAQSTKKEKKEQLSKSQKRRQWNRLDGKGEKPRGWDWVDIVKHLSQTGYKDNNNPVT